MKFYMFIVIYIKRRNYCFWYWKYAKLWIVWRILLCSTQWESSNLIVES